MRALLRISAIVLFLLATTCARLPYKPVATYPAPDTRAIVLVLFADSVQPIMQAVMDSTRPGMPELGRCLYGGVRQLPTHQALEVVVVVPGVIAAQSDTTINFDCADRYGKLDMVGDVHTHPLAFSLEQACVPSRNDFMSMLDDSRILVFYILCANGVGYSEFRDGRWGWFYWRQPQ